MFIYKIENIKSSSKLLKKKIKKKKEFNNGGYDLRFENKIKQTIQLNNHYGESTITYFFAKFINEFILEDLNCKLKIFKTIMVNNLNKLSSEFIIKFLKFNLTLTNFKTKLQYFQYFNI